MNDFFINLSVRLQLLKDKLKEEDGQDLIEYALVVALIAFGATAAMSTLSTNISTAFTNIGTTLTTKTGT